MYKISVPITNRIVERSGREKILASLKKLNAERIFLALDSYYIDPAKRKWEMDTLKENCAWFQEKGLEVGAWFWSFMITGDGGFTHMKTLNGVELEDCCCPLDEEFRKFAGSYAADVAATGVDLIMYDDDYRYGFRGGMNCACDKHLELIGKEVGEALTPDTLREKALSGGKNKYRDALLKVNGDSLKQFAKEMREYVDEVNPKIRMGLCSCMSLWDNDGVDAPTISRILAGNTKPFLRLIGAPYWAVNKGWGNRLQNIIELERMERSWCGDGIEIFSEGDTYPRPRYSTPASYLELFDMALRADGSLDGILKYAMDYISGPDYETGYEQSHSRNAAVYEGIDSIFSGKEACGVRIYERMNKIADMEIPAKKAGSTSVENVFFSVAARMLSDNSVPSTYYGDGVCGIAFAENVEMVTEDAMRRGMIIDARAAQILESKGIDTGMASIGREVDVYEEYFTESKEYVNGGYTTHVCQLKDGAVLTSIVTYMDDHYNEVKIPGSYYYENEKGYRFLVFTFDAYFNSEPMYRTYARSRQLASAVQWLSGKKLPAYSYGNPDLYLMTKKGQNSMAVGLWNIFADAVYEPVVELDREYEKIRFVNCAGRMEGDKVVLTEIKPFSFAGFEVREA